MKENNNNPIGIFDSGVGGLTVVKEVMKILPNEEIVYFGDTARVPYGSKSKETVTKYSRQIMNFLLSKNVKAVIIACNTASSNSYEQLLNEFSVPIIEVVRPGAMLSLDNNDYKRIGVIGTQATINSGAYERIIKENKPDVNVYSKACPLFVPLVEEGWTNNEVAKLTANIYLNDLLEKDIQALILGCTHYPLLIDIIKEIVGGVKIINPAEATAKSMLDFLTNENKLSNKNSNTNHKFYVSDNSIKFDIMSNLVLNKSYKAEIGHL